MTSHAFNARLAVIRTLAATGMSRQKIARALSINEGTLKDVLRRHKIRTVREKSKPRGVSKSWCPVCRCHYRTRHCIACATREAMANGQVEPLGLADMNERLGFCLEPEEELRRREVLKIDLVFAGDD